MRRDRDASGSGSTRCTRNRARDRRTSTWAISPCVGVGLVIGLAGFGPLASPFALAFAMLDLCAAALILYDRSPASISPCSSRCSATESTMVGYPFNANFSSHESISLHRRLADLQPGRASSSRSRRSAGSHTSRATRALAPSRPPTAVASAGVRRLRSVVGPVVRRVPPGRRPHRRYVGAPTAPVPRRDVRPGVEPVHPHRALREPRLGGRAGDLDAEPLRDPPTTTGFRRPSAMALECLTEHPTSMLYAWVILLALAVCVLRGCSRWARFLLLLAAIPTVWVFVLSERRAALVGLRRRLRRLRASCCSSAAARRFSSLVPVRAGTHGGVHRRVLERHRTGWASGLVR